MRTSQTRQSNNELDDGVAHGWPGWLRRRSVDSFFSPHLGEAAILEEGASDHCQGCMTVKALPGSSLEVVEAEFFFQLLMGLLADPSRLNVAANVRRFVPAGRLAR